MFEYPSMPPSKINPTAAPSQHLTAFQQGSNLLLFSLASATVAVSITAGRLLLSETGSVLLLLSDGTSYGIESDFSGQCKTPNLTSAIGQFMVTAAASPYVRSAPLVFIFLSSAAFVVGVILIRNDLYTYAAKLEPIIGTEMMGKIRANIISGRRDLLHKLERGIECVDSMVADDVIRAAVKTVNEIVKCAAGGYALYSLPDQVLPIGSRSINEKDDGRIVDKQNNTARRQVICAMDPSLDDILFRPGGLWSVTPGVREYLTGLTRGSIANKPVITFDADAPTVDSTANGSDSHGVDDDNKKLRSDGSLPKLIHVRQPQQSGASSLRERSTAHEFKDANGSSFVPHTNNSSSTKNQQQDESPSPIQFDKILQRTAFAATFCFFLHLHKSPSTRKTWKSAMHFFTSCGLLSTAVGTGVASLLTSNHAENSVVTSVFVNAIKGTSLLPNSKIQEMWNKIRDAIRRNRRLQMALALIVVYGLKRRANLKPNAGRIR